MERWFISYACEIAGTPSVAVAQLRGETARWAPVLESHGPQAFEAWLSTLPPWR